MQSSQSSLPSLKVGVLNPGRNGLSNPANDNILWWRLWEIATTATSLCFSIVVVPCPRLPPGARLPSDFPFVFIGRRTTTWDSVGVFLQPEISVNIVHLDSMGCDRVIWLKTHSCDGKQTGLLARVYGPPGGDVEFWPQLLQDRDTALSFSGASYTIILGDLNIHLPDMLNHSSLCRCVHCSPSACDQTIALLLRTAGFFCTNPIDQPTHVSGSVIDLILCDSPNLGLAISTVLPPGAIASSDHALVHNNIPMSIRFSCAAGFGRVGWTSGSEWDAALTRIEPSLGMLAQLLEDLVEDSLMKQLNASLQNLALRRFIVDLVVWIRDAWYCVAGHLCQATRIVATGGVKRRRVENRSSMDPTTALPPDVDHFTFSSQRQMLAKYLELRESDRAAADKFLAKKLKQARSFQLALVDVVSGSPLAPDVSLALLQTDLEMRAGRCLSRDSDVSVATKRRVSSVRQRGGTSGAYVPEEPDFMLAELQLVLKSFRKFAATLRCPYAAVISPVGGSRRLTLATCNLFLRNGIVATSCTLREFNHIHKKGPSIIRSIDCLRPISFASEYDMAAVMDALVRHRTLPRLRDVWGSSQSGGVHEALANVLAVVLLAQLRFQCGLPLILLFIDLSHAFDEVDKDDMRLALHEAGVQG